MRWKNVDFDVFYWNLRFFIVHPEFYFLRDMIEYIICVYDFLIGENFDSTPIKFELYELWLKDTIFEVVIYYFNEETQLLENFQLM